MCRYFAVIILFVLLPLSSPAEDSGTVFTDEDLARYTIKSDHEKTDVSSPSPARSETRAVIDRPDPPGQFRAFQEKKDKQYWCNKGKAARKRIEYAKQEVEAAKQYLAEREQEYHMRMISTCMFDGAKARLEDAKRRLENAEEELREIEDDAHSRWLPPGWVRCQF